MTLSRNTIAYLRWQLLEWHLAWWKASDWKKVWKTEILLEKYFYFYLGLSMLKVYRYVCNICLYKNQIIDEIKTLIVVIVPVLPVRVLLVRVLPVRFLLVCVLPVRVLLVQSSPVHEIPYAYLSIDSRQDCQQLSSLILCLLSFTRYGCPIKYYSYIISVVIPY